MKPLDAALHALEWNRFLETAETFALTEPGSEEIDALFDSENWAPSVPIAREMQEETREMLGLLTRDALWGPLQELPNPWDTLESLEKGSVIEVTGLARLRRWLFAVDSWANVPRDSITGDHFKRAIAKLMEPTVALRILERVLTPEGELSERASSKLSAIAAEIRSVKKEIATVMDRLLGQYAGSGSLQETFSDVRDGHYVLPVRVSAQSEVEGTIYGTSASRQTLFIEPKEVAHLNARLRQRESDRLQEIYAILEAVSKQLKPFVDEMGESFTLIAKWDAVQAKARFSLHYGGKTLNVVEGKSIGLRETAHPLLWWSMDAEQITRNDLVFGEPARTLLLTGPNTGGKTVLLKTLGLAGVCARSGFPFPAVEEPVIPFFDHLFVDVGDPQSIEHHLSSFSGHIERFKNILDTVTPRSLVLLDELNTATDPGEGAALGRAFLETVMARGAMIVATTHDPQLKALALSDSRILNASMAFDEKSRSPTFRMNLGVPGRSRALETAERLGLSVEVITLARQYLSDDHNRFEKMLAKLERDAEETTSAKRDANRLRDEAERLKREWTERTEKGVSELLEKTRQRLRRILEQAQDEVRTSVKKLDEGKSRREIDQTRSALNDAFGAASGRLDSALREEAPDLAAQLSSVASSVSPAAPAGGKFYDIGETVRIPKFKNLGQVLEVSGTKVKVQMGALQMALSLSDIDKASDTEAAAAIKAGAAKPRSQRVSIHDRPAAPDSRLDLRGVRLEEAMFQLEQYLDQAFRSGALAEVTIVHGLGTGAIREGTRKRLASLPYVRGFRDGGVGGGGTGATIVEFER